jgi:hypothetical protein
MGISNLISNGGKRLRDRVEIRLGDESLFFREPRVIDVVPTKDQIDSIRVRGPKIVEKQIQVYIWVMSQCYIPQDQEKDSDILSLFCQLAETDLVFMDLVLEFNKEFPEVFNWYASKAESKND